MTELNFLRCDDEQGNLDACRTAIEANLADIGARLNAYATEVQETKEHMWEARRDLDHIDKVALRQSIEQKVRSAEVLRAQRQKLVKLLDAPYFGRVDFARRGAAEAEPVYIGVHDFFDETQGRGRVFDWRAPVSSLFYDYETGPAHYETPSGGVHGRIDRKRQYRIRKGRLELMIESGVAIVDDMLQEELGRASEDGMKTIIATIQRDQNAIIRNADAQTLIILGVAGSGKTSIALHRIAFLLYRFKDTLSAQDILILSPNRVFADYIGNVLPELGEEQVSEIGIEALADELLGGGVKFQSFHEQTALLLEHDDEALKHRIAFKASRDFLTTIDAYLDHLESSSFEPEQWRLGKRVIVPAWFFEESWRRHRGLPVTQRVAEVVAATEHQIGVHYNRTLETRDRQVLRKAVRTMVRRPALRTAYKGLFDWMGNPGLFRLAGGKLEYADVFPLLYFKLRLEGVDNPRCEIRHLLIDEMQDYSPLQYAVLAKLFPCRKTILGDATQSVNPYGASTAEQIQEALRAAPPVKLTKSYRSTWEIMQFALAIAPNAELEPMRRHGVPPELAQFATQGAMVDWIAEAIDAFEHSDHRSLAVIARTQKQARTLAAALTERERRVRLLDADSAGYSTGVLVCTAHLAKGLEFDRVIVADASATTWRTEMDRALLYVACTRAMHQLALTAVGAFSLFLPEEYAPKLILGNHRRPLRQSSSRA